MRQHASIVYCRRTGCKAGSDQILVKVIAGDWEAFLEFWQERTHDALVRHQPSLCTCRNIVLVVLSQAASLGHCCLLASRCRRHRGAEVDHWS